MGDRAIVKPVGKNTGIYLHWNGGPDSVTAFLKYCELKKYREFEDEYGMARFCQVVSNYFGGSLSIGIVSDVESYDSDWLDNGIYVVEGWSIKERICRSAYREGYDINEMLLQIDSCQPQREQLGADYILSPEVDPKDLKIGDAVYWYDPEFNGGMPQIFRVTGYGAEGAVCNGHDVGGIPYINRYSRETGYDTNINNYLFAPVKICHNVETITLTDLFGNDSN